MNYNIYKKIKNSKYIFTQCKFLLKGGYYGKKIF